VLVLLTHSNHLYFDRKQARKMQPYPPLQTLIAAAALREAGFPVTLFDSTFDADFESALERERPDLVVVCEDNFNFLTKMCLTRQRAFAFAIADVARRKGLRAVATGSDSADRGTEYLKAGFEAVIVGEVEQTLVELCRAISQGRPLRGLPGIVDRDGRAEARRPLAELDHLPAPAWDLVDVERYRQEWTNAHGHFALNLVASRGCPYRCNWCAKPVYGNSYRFRSPALVADEMLAVKNAYAPDRLWFSDDIFALSPAWTRRFADEVERRAAQVPFKMQSRCDLMTRDTVDALRRGGCAEVWMGAESGSQKILDAMDKGTRVEHIYDARENLRRHGIRACFFIQLGYLGETWEDIERTVRMIRETQPDDIGVSVSYPLPGTKFHDLVAAELGERRNWDESGDLAMMFHGAYSTGFYRALADSLHAEVKTWTSC
jgi:anaerobic magnesium-protoporphyrin IX monomethyl ester cyclase